MKYEYLKGSEKDFEGAPEWAAYLVSIRGEDSCAWVSHDDKKYQYSRDVDWQVGYEISGSFIKWEWRNGVEIIAERRPITEPSWDGVGLPPVGVACEFRKMMRGKPDEFRSGVVSYLSEHTVVIIINGERGEFVHHPDTCEFRPIRSESDKKRDAAIKALDDWLPEYTTDIPSLDGAIAIYDAIAACKIPGVKLED